MNKIIIFRAMKKTFIFSALFIILSALIFFYNLFGHDEYSWNSGGPYGGYVRKIAISQSNPNIVYIGTKSGIYKTLDGGESWDETGLSEGLKIKDVAIDPSNSNIVYAGVGEIYGNIDVEDGFYQSTDGASTWTQKYNAKVTALAVDPNNPNILFFGTKNGEIYRSTNGGENWELKHTETYSSTGVGINSIIVDPGDSSFVYVGTGGDTMHGGDSGFLYSTDGGNTWAGTHVGYLWGDLGCSVVVTPKGYSPHTLYIISDGDVGYKDVYKSIDKGKTWTELYMPRFNSNYIDEPSTLAVDPLNPDWLYVGTSYRDHPLRLYKSSENYWYYWEWEFGGGLPSSIPSSVAINPGNNSVLFVGFSDCPIYKSTDFAESWNISNKGINNADVCDIALSPVSSHTAFAAIDGFHLHKTSDGGASWTELNGSSGAPANIEAVAINPNNPSIVFIGSKWGYFYRSTDEGISWEDMAYTTFFPREIKDIWINPSDSNIVLVAAEEYDVPGYKTYFGGVFRNTTGGVVAQWNFTYKFWRPTCLASDPTNHQNVYLGTRNNGYVIKSSNAGITWINISPGSNWVDTVYDIVVDSDSKVFAATDDGLWRYDGTGWTHISGLTDDDVITALAIDKSADPETIYMGTKGEGVFISQDGGDTWTEFNDGLGYLNITKLAVSDTQPRVIYAGTPYGSVWTRAIQQYTLTIAAGDGGITDPAPGTYYYSKDAEVSITATPDDGCRCAGWTGDVPPGCENDNPITITMDSDKTITANFIRQHTLTIEAGAGGTTDPTPNTYTHDSGTQVQVTAIPDSGSGYQFSGWIGAATGTTNPITITMDADKTLTAAFSAISTGDGDGGGAKKGCFIATAAYGSPIHPHLDILRDFRDKYLMPNGFGRKFVELYYRYSPSIASLIAGNKLLKAAVRIKLLPVIAFSSLMVHFGPVAAAVVIVFMLVFTILFIRFYPGKVRIP